eukprot:GCRY01003551.1.p1 GENE.GCRY01003551.1~~GCRY01003551.1.p1  ORF type:complete len:293 (+),score=27.58 GCRY01003551.1:287-1165(+)
MCPAPLKGWLLVVWLMAPLTPAPKALRRPPQALACLVVSSVIYQMVGLLIRFCLSRLIALPWHMSRFKKVSAPSEALSSGTGGSETGFDRAEDVSAPAVSPKAVDDSLALSASTRKVVTPAKDSSPHAVESVAKPDPAEGSVLPGVIPVEAQGSSADGVALLEMIDEAALAAVKDSESNPSDFKLLPSVALMSSPEVVPPPEGEPLTSAEEESDDSEEDSSDSEASVSSDETGCLRVSSVEVTVMAYDPQEFLGRAEALQLYERDGQKYMLRARSYPSQIFVFNLGEFSGNS